MADPATETLLELEHELPVPTLANTEKQRPQPGSRLSRLLTLLRPEFLDLFRGRSGPQKPLRSTAWLDGLRGWAALLVFHMHHNGEAHLQFWGHQYSDNGFGYKGEWYFVAFPLIRPFISGGHVAVAVFFVISGYVLSQKSLALIQGGEHIDSVLASALFRRFFRLWVPTLIVLFLYMCTWYLPFGLGVWVSSPPAEKKMGAFWPEVKFFYEQMKVYTLFYKPPKKILTYSPHVWSIETEAKGSVLIFTTLLAVSKIRRNARFYVYAALMVYFELIAVTPLWGMFIAGVWLSDMDLLSSSASLPSAFQHPFYTKRKTLIRWTVFAISYFLSGVPAFMVVGIEQIRESPGWYWLSLLCPPDYIKGEEKFYFLYFASFGLVFSIPRLPALKAFFETRFCQYLGRISFMLYLVHGPLLWSVGQRVYAAVGWYYGDVEGMLPGWINLVPLPHWGITDLDVAFLVAFLFVMTPITFWVAEVATKLIDEPCVRLTAKMYDMAKEKGSGNGNENGNGFASRERRDIEMARLP